MSGVAELSFLYTGDNSGDGSVVIISALPPPACGCDYRCVVLDEFCVNVRCICPEGWKLKKDNSTACERKLQQHQCVYMLVTDNQVFLFDGHIQGFRVLYMKCKI